MRKKGNVHHGGYYGRFTANGPLIPAPAGVPDSVICRRIVDYGPGQIPAAAAFGRCSTCDAPVAYNPAGPHQDRPRVCMQCTGIQPLPIENE